MEPWYDEILKLGKKYFIGKFIEKTAKRKGLFIGKHVEPGVITCIRWTLK